MAGRTVLEGYLYLVEIVDCLEPAVASEPLDTGWLLRLVEASGVKGWMKEVVQQKLGQGVVPESVLLSMLPFAEAHRLDRTIASMKNIINILHKYAGKKVRITIEEID